MASITPEKIRAYSELLCLSPRHAKEKICKRDLAQTYQRLSGCGTDLLEEKLDFILARLAVLEGISIVPQDDLPNTLVMSGKFLVMDDDYLAGAMAHRDGSVEESNPHDGEMQSRHAAWRAGFLNDQAGCHVRFGIDALEEPREGLTFSEPSS